MFHWRFGNLVRQKRAFILLGVLPWALIACQTDSPDVAADAVRLTGLQNAIVFRDTAEPLDVVPLADSMLTEAQAVRLALLHDPRLQASVAQVRVAQADAQQAQLLPNPILSISLRSASGGMDTAFDATLTADLIALLQKPRQIAAADKRLRGAAADALTTTLDLISEVQQAYASAQAIDGEIENARRRGQILQQLRDIAQDRVDAGDALPLDVLTLDAQLMQAKLDLSDLELERAGDRFALARLVGQARANTDWQLSPWEPPAAAVATPEAQWIDAALTQRTEIQAHAWELRALGDDLSVAALSPLAGGDVGIDSEHDPEWRVGPTFSTPLPIFDFGQAARAKVKAQQIAARHELAAQELEIIEEVRLAYATDRHAQQALLDAQSKLLPLAQQQLDLAQLAYKNGDADLPTLLLAEADYQETASKIIELQEKVSIARAKLQRAAGGAAIAGPLESPTTTQPATQEDAPPATAPAPPMRGSIQ